MRQKLIILPITLSLFSILFADALDTLWTRNCDGIESLKNTLQAKVQNRLADSIQIKCGYYFDNNANGLVDSIYVEATTDITGGLTNGHVHEILDSGILTLPAFRNFTINNSGVVSGGFFIDVTEGIRYPTTYVTSDDKLTVIQGILTTGALVIDTIAPMYDRVAPIIHWARGAAYLIDYLTDTIDDTLGVKFSEPIENITHEQPLYFLDISSNPDTNYTVMLGIVSQPKPDSMVFIVKSHDPMHMEEGDSVWIHETNRVSDASDNFQNNISNIKRELRIMRILSPYNLIFYTDSSIDINSINDHVIPNDIINILTDQGIINDLDLSQDSSGNYIGMLFTAKPENTSTVLPDFKLIGDITISDDDGNQIVSENMMAWNENEKGLVWVWNVKKQNGEHAYSGIYTCTVIIEERTPSLGYENGGPKILRRLYIEIMGNPNPNPDPDPDPDPEPDSCGNCGTSSGLAFIPPIGFKIFSMVKRRKKWWYKLLKQFKIVA